MKKLSSVIFALFLLSTLTSCEVIFGVEEGDVPYAPYPGMHG
jgi:hypothetical protein